MQKIYRLTPATKEIVWGGKKLIEYGKPLPQGGEKIAESWELSFVPGSEAIAEGVTTAERFPRETWGTASKDFPAFPVLTKFIDAEEKLSVQVHPSDDYALKNEGQYGKTEMWVVAAADEDAGIYAGLKREVSKEEFSRAVADGSVEDLLDFHPVKPGDVYFIPSGTIHAILGGVLIYEIQQNSTLTYRLYDYMRRDKDGNLRPLHVEKAMKVASLSPYKPAPVSKENPEIIGKCKYFITRRFAFTGEKTFDVGEESYLSFSVMRGSLSVEGMRAGTFETFFAPAGAGRIALRADAPCEIITVSTEK